jgi:putrescine transport system substrate-binding protein
MDPAEDFGAQNGGNLIVARQRPIDGEPTQSRDGAGDSYRVSHDADIIIVLMEGEVTLLKRRARLGGLPWAATIIAELCLLLTGCGHSGSPSSQSSTASQENVVNVYNWYDYIKPEVLRKFEARYGVQVHYNVFDSNNTLTARLLAGHSGYDVAFPSGAYLESMVAAGVFRPLDKSLLPNLRNLDPLIMQRLAAYDPGNAHAVDYTWGITGIAYDEAKVRARLPQAPVDSWSLLFDPKVAARFADCGIGLYESPYVVVPSVLAWLGEPPDSEDAGKLDRVEKVLLAVRPYIRKISSGSLVDDLATGELCIIIASNGDAMQAQERTRIAANGIQVRYSIPKEGAVMWFDVAAIPADAPHPGNAYKLINFLMDPAIAAENSNAIHFPNGNAASQSMLQPELANAAILPTGELAARLFPERAKSEAYVRLRTRMWTRFRTGQ